MSRRRSGAVNFFISFFMTLVRLILLVLLVVLLYKGVTVGFAIGHSVFAPKARDRSPGKTFTVSVAKGQSTYDVGKELEKRDVIESAESFVIQAKLYDYDVKPGTYTLNTSQNSLDYLKIMDSEDTGTEIIN